MNKSSALITLLTLIALFAFASDGLGKTWHVAHDGSGDAPDIPAAFDSSAVGDTILVGPGSYDLPQSSFLPDGVTMASEHGPSQTVLLPGSLNTAAVINIGNNSALIGFWVQGVQGSIQSAVGVPDNGIVAYNVIESSGVNGVYIYSGEVHHNLIMGPGRWGVYAAQSAVAVNLHHNIILNDVDCDSGGFQSLCNNVLGVIGCPLDLSSFSLDPQFCGVDNYYLQSDSPCAPGNHPDGLACGQIGPFPVGCGSVDTRERSWGTVKSLYWE